MPMKDDTVSKEILKDLSNPILDAFQDADFTEKDVSQTILSIFQKLKKEAEKKRINFQKFIQVSKEARPWADILLKLYDAYPTEKHELEGEVTLRIVYDEMKPQSQPDED